MYSDNGTNFRGANKELMQAMLIVNIDDLQNYGVNKCIQWVFNPPGAPHMGGVWERLIRTVKSALYTIL